MGKIERAAPVVGEVVGIELHAGSGSLVAQTAASDRGHTPRCGDLAQVRAVGDEEATGAAGDDPSRLEKQHLRAGAIARQKFGCARGRAIPARHGAYDAIGRESAKQAVSCIEDEDIARGIRCDPSGKIEGGVARGPIGAPAFAFAATCERGDHSIGRDLAESVVPCVGDEQIARGIEPEALRHAKACRAPGAPYKARRATAIGRSGNETYRAVGRALADVAGEVIGEIDRAIVSSRYGGDRLMRLKHMDRRKLVGLCAELGA